MLRVNILFANKEKCTFCVDSVIFLGFVVNKNGVHVDPTKIKAIQEWPTPKNVGEVGASMVWQAFIGGLFLTSLLWPHPSMNLSRKMYLLIGVKNKSLLFSN